MMSKEEREEEKKPISKERVLEIIKEIQIKVEDEIQLNEPHES